jgi:hypothetical protein
LIILFILKDFYERIKLVVGDIDNEIVCALKLARFKTFSSFKNLENVDSVFDSVTSRIKKLDKTHLAFQGIAFLLDDDDCTNYEMDVATKSSVKAIYEAVKNMTPVQFMDIEVPVKRAPKRKATATPTLGPINEVQVEAKIRKRFFKLKVQVGPEPIQVRRIRENSFEIVCQSCDFTSTVTYDVNYQTIRMRAMEKHMKEQHGQNDQVFLCGNRKSFLNFQSQFN